MDRISGLSDELLIKILLCLPTKVAVSTSILSKRWEYLWMWLPKLNYSCSNSLRSEYKRLRCFLDRNMSLHRAPVIKRFCLELNNSHFNAKDINLWVVLAISHSLRELEILYECDPAKANVLPNNLFTCKSLVILKLDGEFLLDVPRMVSLPSLKTLKLQRVTYFNDKTLQRLLSNCPILEDLVVELRENGTTGKLTIVVPSLQSLSLIIPYSHVIDGFVIETPSLKYFKLGDHYYKDHYCMIENMPYLIVAHLDVKLHVFKSLIGSITSVKRLAICSGVMFDEGIVFNQHEHLEVCLCKVFLLDNLVRLIKASSNLKRLDISIMKGHLYQRIVLWDQPSTIPDCLLTNLQTLNWLYYKGIRAERDMVVYILKHAVHLKTATIKSCESHVPKFEMLKELACSCRASTTCQLMFE